MRSASGQAMLSPLRFHYDADEFTLPIRLGLANSSGKQDLIVTILSPEGRYQASNYDNTTIPTPFGLTWVGWEPNGGSASWEDEPQDRHSYRGIAAAETARLTVTTGSATRDIQIDKSGFERYVALAARRHRLAYGLVCVALSLGLGWAAAAAFRRRF